MVLIETRTNTPLPTQSKIRCSFNVTMLAKLRLYPALETRLFVRRVKVKVWGAFLEHISPR